MTELIPAIIWIIGAGVGYLIMKKRGIKLTILKNLLTAVLGPLSIPLALLYKKED